MELAKLSLEQRAEALFTFLHKYLKRSYQVVSHSETTAELYKPARFPSWLFKEQTRFIDIDDAGNIYVRKV